MKYFSGLSFAIHWMSTPRSLPPSSAGKGMILKIANAKEINPAKPRYNFRHHSLSKVSPSFTAQTGQVNLLSAIFIFFPLKERRLDQRLPNALKVSFVSAPISWSPASIALPRGNCISLILTVSLIAKLIHKRQSSSPQLQFLINILLPLCREIWISCPIASFKMVFIFIIFTGFLLIVLRISPDWIPITLARLPDKISSTLAGMADKLPLVNHCASRNEYVGIR